MSTRQALSTELAQALVAAHEKHELTYEGVLNDGRYDVTYQGRPRKFDAAGQAVWLQMLQRARSGGEVREEQPIGSLTAVRAVLVNPAFPDLVRLRIWAAMEDAGLGISEFADLVGVTRKTVTEALKYLDAGTELTMRMAARMTAAIEGPWELWHGKADWSRKRGKNAAGLGELALTPTRPRGTSVVPRQARGRRSAPEPVQEPSGITRARVLAYAAEHGWIRWVGPLDPNEAQRTTQFTVVRAGETLELADDAVLPAMTGLADVLDPTAADQLAELATIQALASVK